jgi:hypothetical protein
MPCPLPRNTVKNTRRTANKTARRTPLEGTGA